MRLDDERESSNVEDRRGAGGGGIPGIRIGGIGLLVLLVGAYLLGVDPRIVLGQLENGGPSPAVQTTARDTGNGEGVSNDPERRFVAKAWRRPKMSGGNNSSKWAALISNRGWCFSARAFPRAVASQRPRLDRSTARPIVRYTSTSHFSVSSKTG